MGELLDLVVGGVARLRESDVRLRARLPVRSAEAWSALTEPTRLAEWIGRVEGTPSEGARFRVWHDEETVSQHEVTAWVVDRLLDLSWEFPGEPVSTVSFMLVPDGTSTALALTHQGLADPVGYAAGWHRHLVYLAAHLAGAPMHPRDFWTGYDDLVERYAATAR